MKTIMISGNPLLLAARGLFEGLAQFVANEQGASVSKNWGEDIKQYFREFKRDLALHEVSIAVSHHALYAAASLVDELIMYSQWEGRQAWVQQSLQLTYFSDNKAGEQFFVNLQQFCTNPPHYRELIEFYYVCLQLGFSGQYREHKNDLKVFINKLYEQIKYLYQEEAMGIKPQSLPASAHSSNLDKKWKTCLLISVFLMACQYMGYSMALSVDYHKLKHAWVKHLKLYPYHNGSHSA